MGYIYYKVPHSSHQPLPFKGLIEGLNPLISMICPISRDLVPGVPGCHFAITLDCGDNDGIEDYGNRKSPG